jgi:hypothetical protein
MRLTPFRQRFGTVRPGFRLKQGALSYMERTFRH